jgi:acetyl-CoA carboxylase biotin carboxyl carrier protein
VNRDKLRQLIRLVEESDIDELEIRRWGKTVRIVKNGARASALPAARAEPEAAAHAPAPASQAPAPAGTPHHEVKSPMVGTFYRAPSPEAPPFVEVGDRVRPGQTLCILEAMKLMNELQSEVSGVVRAIQVENGAPVEYGQALFAIELG